MREETERQMQQYCLNLNTCSWCEIVHNYIDGLRTITHPTDTFAAVIEVWEEMQYSRYCTNKYIAKLVFFFFFRRPAGKCFHYTVYSR